MNVKSLPWFKFPHEAYLFSEFHAKASPLAKAALLELLCICMKQTPAMSLPNDDVMLARWAQISLKSWLRIKALVLSEFTFDVQQNRYYSRLLMAQYNEAATESTPAKTPRSTAMTGAERVAKHRAKTKAAATLAVTENVTNSDEVTLAVTPCNAANTVQGGTIGGENKNEKSELKPEVVAATTTFAMFLAWQPDLEQLNLLLAQLHVNTAHHAEHLARFVVHYHAENRQYTQAQWLRCYAQWLQRERSVTVACPASPAAVPTQPAVDNRPQWQIFAERKQQRQAAAREGAKKPRPPVLEALLVQMGINPRPLTCG